MDFGNIIDYMLEFSERRKQKKNRKEQVKDVRRMFLDLSEFAANVNSSNLNLSDNFCEENILSSLALSTLGREVSDEELGKRFAGQITYNREIQNMIGIEFHWSCDYPEGKFQALRSLRHYFYPQDFVSIKKSLQISRRSPVGAYGFSLDILKNRVNLEDRFFTRCDVLLKKGIIGGRLSFSGREGYRFDSRESECYLKIRDPEYSENFHYDEFNESDLQQAYDLIRKLRIPEKTWIDERLT